MRKPSANSQRGAPQHFLRKGNRGDILIRPPWYPSCSQLHTTKRTGFILQHYWAD